MIFLRVVVRQCPHWLNRGIVPVPMPSSVAKRFSLKFVIDIKHITFVCDISGESLPRLDDIKVSMKTMVWTLRLKAMSPTSRLLAS